MHHLHPMRRQDDDVASQSPLLGQAEDSEAPEQYSLKKPLSRLRRRRKRSSMAEGQPERGPYARRRCSRYLILGSVCVLLMFGVVQIVNLAVNVIALFVPNGIDNVIKNWGKPGHPGAFLAHWPTDFSRDIFPIPCHSHNDYWREVPLYSAIQAGCTGVEADIWRFEDQLYVGHSIASLTPERTLEALYINPLMDILKKMNPKTDIAKDPHAGVHGVFDVDSSQTLVLLIDFKTYGPSTWPAMYKALDPLRQKGYLTHVANSTVISRPITVVGTGNTPFSHITSDTHNPHHDIFFDAPLDRFSKPDSSSTTTTIKTASSINKPDKKDSEDDTLRPRTPQLDFQDLRHESRDEEIPPTDPTAYTTLNSYYASTSFATDIGDLERGEFSEGQLGKVRSRFRGAQAQGLKARYWDTPYWPIGLRNHVWSVLEKEGTDYLNVDDLKGATRRNWGRWKGWWRKGMKVGA